ncbi:fibronectin type III domain-containing protein [Sphingomonas sp. NIBR02145]|uniref:fibronectin type III domain-containing protein n=1 Tax=Sphingomonas sp. NIBR02145 TaxID=3014784 RepID=UPI0022B500D6|nr:fibronectin type III domain-containing protein [Sphingomonas sp. NIBR02145]WHU04259.1 fibronectin type III domain-containing protein [Sphingomonas sp. NIBR02145]
MSSLAATPAAPTITAVQCQSGGTNPVFDIVWQPQDYQGPYSVVVTNNAGATIAGTTSMAGPNGATWTATQAMNAATDSYSVQAEATGFPGVISNKAPLLFAPVTAVATLFDGVTLQVGWSPPASLTPAGSAQILLLSPAGAQATVSDTSGFGTMIVGANLRGGSGDWTVYVTPQFDISSGPQSDPATVYHATTTIAGVTVLGMKGPATQPTAIDLQVAIQLAGEQVGQTSFIAALRSHGTTLLTTAPFTGSWQSRDGFTTCTANVSLAYPLNLASVFEVAVAQSSAIAGIATGPLGVATPLNLLQPQGLSATVTAQGADRVIDVVLTPFEGPGAAATASRIAATVPIEGATVTVTTPLMAGFKTRLPIPQARIGAAYLLYGAQASGMNIGPWTGASAYPGAGEPVSGGLPLVTSLPVIASVTVDQAGMATLGWGAIPDAGLTGYRLSAMSGGAEVTSTLAGGTSGSLPAVAGSSFAVSGVAGPVTGPASAAVTPITIAPGQPKAAWTSTGTQCVLSWQAPASGPSPTGYKIAIYDGATLIHQADSAAPSYTVPAGVLGPGALYRFQVLATVSGPPVLTGPSSALAEIVTAAPAALTIGYDGARLAAHWAPVAGATGYRAVLLLDGAESGQPWFSAEASASLALGYDPAKAYSLAVQALAGGATGPAASAPIFGAGLYPSFVTGNTAALLPAIAPGMAAHPIAIGLPQIFTTAPQGTLPATAPFALTAGTAPYSYVLTIDGVADALPWTFTADPIRADLLQAYTAFLTQLSDASATALGLQTVQQAISRAMPQSFAETMLYGYGFTGASGYADLTPGMVLRVEYESYQTMGAATPNQAELNGFITTAVARYPIVRSAGGATTLTGLDAFIARLMATGGTSVSEPVITNRKQAGAGGLIDSGYANLQRPFLRLVYPPTFPGTNEIGTPYPEFNAVLLAASKLSDLEAATRNLRAGNPAGPRVGTLYFRGRTTLVPELRVFLNDIEQLVPLGSTLGDMLAGRAMEPSPVGLPLTGIEVTRGIGAALVGSPSSYDAGSGMPLRVDWAPAGNTALLALPLLGGDRVRLGGRAA